MESAYRLLDPSRADGPRELINIWAYQRPGPEQDRLRSWHFVCEECGCRMFPSFPAEDKAERLTSPSPYFRAGRSEGHRSPCSRAVQLQPSGSAGEVTDGRQRRGRAPAEFIDAYAGTSSTTRGCVEADDDRESGSANSRRRRQGATVRTSVSRTTSIRSLAAFWHADSRETATLPLKLPQCPGITYGEVFRNVDADFAKNLHAAGQRFIFWSDKAVVLRTRGDHGYFVRFGVESRTKKALAALILDEPADGPLPMTVRRRLAVAAEGSPSTLYCLGGFRFHRATDLFLLQPVSKRHVWVEPGAPA